MLLTRAVAVFAVNAVLGMAASAATLGHHGWAGTAQLTFGWLIPMTAVCALTLAVAVAVRSAARRRGRRRGRLDHPRARPQRGRQHDQRGAAVRRGLTSVITDANLYLPYLAVAACCAAIVYFVTRPQRGVQ